MYICVYRSRSIYIYIYIYILKLILTLILIGNAWIGRFSFLMQKQNAITIQHSMSMTNARKKEMRSDNHANHGIRSLSEFSKINLN